MLPRSIRRAPRSDFAALTAFSIPHLEIARVCHCDQNEPSSALLLESVRESLSVGLRTTNRPYRTWTHGIESQNRISVACRSSEKARLAIYAEPDTVPLNTAMVRNASLVLFSRSAGPPAGFHRALSSFEKGNSRRMALHTLSRMFVLQTVASKKIHRNGSNEPELADAHSLPIQTHCLGLLCQPRRLFGPGERMFCGNTFTTKCFQDNYFFLSRTLSDASVHRTC